MLHAIRTLLVIFALGPLPIAVQADDPDTRGPVDPQAADRDTGQGEPTVDLRGLDLSGVTDRTELAFEESPAYYAILDHVRQTAPESLRQKATELRRRRWAASPRFRQYPLEDYPLFYDLTQEPEEYRGKPVGMQGHLIRLVKYSAGPNDYGIDTLYEAWLVTPDAEAHPTTVICTEIPAGMPIGEELIDGVSVTGYFFKLHTYSSRDNKVRFAPMVLAHRLQWSPVTAASGWPVSQTTVIVAALALTVLGVGIAWMNSRRSAAVKQRRRHESVPERPPEFLNDLTP